MDHKDLAPLLKEDFAQSCERLDHDGFTERVLARLARRRKVRLTVISAAGAAGAVFAITQFLEIAKAFDTLSALTMWFGDEAQLAAGGAMPISQVLAAAAIAVAFAATAFVMQNE